MKGLQVQQAVGHVKYKSPKNPKGPLTYSNKDLAYDLLRGYLQIKKAGKDSRPLAQDWGMSCQIIKTSCLLEPAPPMRGIRSQHFELLTLHDLSDCQGHYWKQKCERTKRASAKKMSGGTVQKTKTSKAKTSKTKTTKTKTSKTKTSARKKTDTKAKVR